MTNKAFAGESVDTVDYRNAIVFYLKEIHGIRDESFKYRKINDMLGNEKKDQKTYIKHIVCNPDLITLDQYQKFSKSLYDSDKCQVCIIGFETKRQVSLLYMTRALSDYMK